MTLRSVPLDSQTEKKHRQLLAETLNELVKFYNTIRPGEDWTPVIAGASTAGTYEIASHLCRYTRIGRRVTADLFITMASSLTGGGSGVLLIQGLPFSKAADTFPLGTLQVSGVDLDAGAIPSLAFDSTGVTSNLTIRQGFDNAGATNQGIAALAADDVLIGSICYETDEP